MPGESPLSMMQTDLPRAPKSAGAGGVRVSRRRLPRVFVAAVIVVALAVGWCGLWYFAASITGRTLTGWLEREAAAGRIYSCGSQDISGFPFRIEVRCTGAAATLKDTQPPFAVAAKDITFAAQVFRPTVLTGEVSSPISLADLAQPPRFTATWSLARLSVSGVPPQPDSLAVNVEQPRINQVAGATATTLFAADRAAAQSRVIEGTAAANPVVDTVVQFASASAPTVHPLLADPLQANFELVVRGLKDLSPKSWAARFREMQAAGGNIEIKSLRIERTDAVVVGNGTLTVNEHGRLDGIVRVAVSGIEHIVPLLGIDRLIGQSIDRFTGQSGQQSGGLATLDRLMPGLSGVVRQSANAGVIDNLKRMGQPTEIDNKPAIILPLRFNDGVMSVGMIPLGTVPALF